MERKNIHILEVAHALHFQAHLATSFCGDCVQADVHIINRLSSTVLNNSTPYKKLFQELVVYTHIQVFGCLAFASNPSFTVDKFYPMRVSCIFLEYTSFKKGYKLLNLLTKQTFVSRDVIFKEDIFPYHPDSVQKYMTPLPLLATTINSTIFDDIYVTTLADD